MSEEELFLRAIVLFPEEDTPRLAYADWLEERQGGCPRAEFIRAQIEVARCDTCDGGEGLYWKCCHEQLCTRIAELLERHEHDAGWLPEYFPPFDAHARCQWSRGFVERVVLGVEELVSTQFAVPLFGRHPIRRVHLNGRSPYPVADLDEPWVGKLAGHYFWRDTGFPISMHATHDIPHCLFGLLPEEDRVFVEGSDHLAFYPTAQRALDALSESCVKYGRKEAGLE